MFQVVIIIIVIVILFISLIGKPSYESFMFTKGSKHALMDDWGKVIGIYDKVPFGVGDDTFKRRVCPGEFDDNTVCWGNKFSRTHINKPYLQDCDDPEGWHRMNSTAYGTKALRHVVHDAYGGSTYVSIKPPCRRGDYSCTRVPCKHIHEYDVMCWHCNTGYHNPQLE